MDIKLLAWLKDGKYRTRILTILRKNNRLPSELATELDINRASVSRILKALSEKELVKGVSSESRTICYTITEKGSQALKDLQDNENE